MDPLQRQRRKKAAEDARYLAVLRDPVALIDGWRCPVCKKEFGNQYACPHGWTEVKADNDQFLLNLRKT